MDGLSFREQLNFFYNADIILSSHGGAITNIMFSTPHTVVIECDPPYFYEMSYTANIMISRVHFILVSTFYQKYWKDQRWKKAERAYNIGTFGPIHRDYVNLNVDPPVFNVVSAVHDAINYIKRWRFVYEVTDKWSPLFYFYVLDNKRVISMLSKFFVFHNQYISKTHSFK